jgi:hypothetical protein
MLIGSGRPPGIERLLLAKPIARAEIAASQCQPTHLPGDLNIRFMNEVLHSQPGNKERRGNNQQNSESEEDPALCRERNRKKRDSGHAPASLS